MSKLILRILEKALQELNPERFFSDIDRRIATQPHLSMANQLLERKREEWFSPISFDEMIDRFGPAHEKIDTIAIQLMDGSLPAASLVMSSRYLYKLKTSSPAVQSRFLYGRILEDAKLVVKRLNEAG